MTFDNGKEFSGHDRISKDLGLDSRFKSEVQHYLHIIKDGTADLQMDVVVQRTLFEAGSKRYFTISRETESGLYCTYKGGVAPNI